MKDVAQQDAPPGAKPAVHPVASARIPAANETMVFGRAPAAAAQPPAANQTMVFGSAMAPPAPTPSAPGSRARTQMFGTGQSPIAQVAPSKAAEVSVGLGLVEPQPVKVELPPANLPFLAQPAPPDSGFFEEEPSFLRRHRTAIIGLLALALLGGLGLRLIKRHRPTVSPEADAIHERAIALLRRDDKASKEEAVRQLEHLANSFPTFSAGKATLVTALSLQWDDALVAMQQNKMASDVLSRKITATEEKKAPFDWQNRVNDMNEQLRTLRSQAPPLKDAVEYLSKRAKNASAALQSSEDLGGVRARAVYLAVSGSDGVLPLAEKYRSLGGTDGWDVIATAEFILNGKAPPELAAKGKAALERLRASDPAFVRAYLLGARMEIQARQYDKAATLLDAAVALNPAHEAARRALAWLQDAPPGDRDRAP